MNRRRIVEVCRGSAKQALVAACIGAVVSGFYAIAEWPSGSPPATIAIGAIIGIFIFAFVGILEKLFRAPIDRLGSTGRAIGHALLFVVAGSLGGSLGLLLGIINGIWRPAEDDEA